MKRILLLFCIIHLVFAQGLFESAQMESSAACDLGGDIRSYIHFDTKNDSLYSKNIYSRATLKLKAQKADVGFVYAELQFIDSYYFGEHNVNFNLREAYIDISLGPLTTRLGKQIAAWGRADVFTSTDNITPRNMTHILPDFDDMRLGNILVNTSLQIGSAVKLQGIWIPLYMPNELPISVFDLPQGVIYTGIDMPDHYFINSGGAVKLDLLTSEYDAAFSYLNAYALQPGFSVETIIFSPTMVSYNFFQKPWRQQVFGFDAAFNASAWSFRCEGAYILPENEDNDPYIPNPEIQWTFGLDRSWDTFRFLMEYNGKFVSDFIELTAPENPMLLMGYQLDIYKRLFFRQTDEILHSIFIRPALTLFHEIFEVEIPFSYNIITEEYLIAPRLILDLADALQLSLGAYIYHGDNNTLFTLLKPLYNGYYCELKLSF